MKLAIFLASTVLMAPALAGPTKFDLHCTGTETDSVKGMTRPWSNWIKVDLDTMQYCLVGCQSQPPGINTIQQVQADRIVLVDKEEQNPYAGSTVDRMILNRTDGTVEFYNAATAYGLAMKGQGTCKASKFTGFPKTQF